ncbi:Glycerophosphodiester phosphodiesterase, cytoplasmic [Streptomyces sp. RB5]|uniref:Glycerophosphodiester phosphodiesterase, cytoplasmic n=1 Tax=Streptomyces smaragdinus TaxID=2585196 RepID=A0A7K0CR54_9ACTN|nr:glycerophosphodiester phosphodiesterase [Streptomyces smaragdinus]MQY15968.1 Glycerophosphodiester phosphodiesterase, cytoplasmic [Streptomyces smaragdinus]
MDIKAVAHRGDPYTARENTLPSLRCALAKGADAVEFDVRLTRDGVPVLLHDATLERLWGHDVPLAQLTYEELRRLTHGGVPTLRAALDVMAEAPDGVRSFVDLTHAGAAEATVAEVHASGAADRVYYCGDTSGLLAVRRADADAEIALGWAPHRARLLPVLRPRWLNYRFGHLTPDAVRTAHDQGFLVSAWTVDWPRNMRRLVAMGVDSITTNRVAALRRVLR